MIVNPRNNISDVVYHKGPYWVHLLFLIYINDLCSTCVNTMPLLFADDTNLFASGTDLKSLQACVNKDLSAIAEWLKANKLSLNVKKKNIIWFSMAKGSPTSI